MEEVRKGEFEGSIVEKFRSMKGQKTGGRTVGTPNKTTKQLRTWITDFIHANTKQIEADWQSLGPQQRLLLFEKLLKYALPSLQSVNVTKDLEKGLEGLTDTQLQELSNQILEQYEQ